MISTYHQAKGLGFRVGCYERLPKELAQLQCSDDVHFGAMTNTPMD
jgi:hypothetical protein